MPLRRMSTQRQTLHETAIVKDFATGETHQVHVPSTDIDGCIGFSFVRCAFSILSLLLVLTDIPRTGLTVDFKDWPQVAPGVFMYYGPYNYPTATYVRNESTGVISGLRRGKPLTAAKLWAYKFDTLSIPQRAIAMHLNVTAYPSCVLYRGRCQDAELLPLATTFSMLDGLVSALQQRFFVEPSERRPFVFVTTNNWLDRLHHTIVQFMWRRQDDRLFTAHYIRYDAINQKGSRRKLNTDYPLCGKRDQVRDSVSDRRSFRPLICEMPHGWRCAFTFPAAAENPAKTIQVPIGSHIDLRTQALRQQYPELNIDLTIITTRNIFTNPHSLWLPMISYWSENIEVTTLLRARRCRDTNASECETVVVDDYRYERTSMDTDARDWDAIISVLRGSAQAYVWLRLASAWISCFFTRRAERVYRDRSALVQVVAAWSTFFLIPIHCLIYSSWFPVLAYALSHVLDSGVTHIVQNSIWATSNGILEKFEFVKYTIAASLQMRNIWLIALAWKVVLWMHMKSIAAPRGRGWTPTDGLIGFRGLFIGSISSLTVFSFLRALRFRDTDVVAIQVLPRHVPLNGIQGPAMIQNAAEYGYRLDGKTGVVTTVIVSAAWLTLQLLVSLLTRRPTHFFFSRTYYVPLSAGSLWPQSLLHVFWYLPVTFSQDRRSSFFAAIRRSSSVAMVWKQLSVRLIETALLPSVKDSGCVICRQPTSALHWRMTQGCPQHEPIFRIDKRPREIWSAVRLVNTGLLSDPVVLFQIFVIGRPVFLYRFVPKPATPSENSTDTHEHTPDSTRSLAEQRQILLPIWLQIHGDRLDEPIVSHQFDVEFITTVEASTVPWHLLVSCG
ncbi:hypothetical protein PINS_up007721 [Pythium insidiosum]|nr:hypothetical protein PINS_up007721 [Pythium insidiosum]